MRAYSMSYSTRLLYERAMHHQLGHEGRAELISVA
jgi:hypothetical protein